MKKVIVLGSTGSIGTQTLEIIHKHRDRFAVSVLCCGRNIPLLRQQIAAFGPKTVVVECQEDAATLAADFPALHVLYGEEGIVAAVTGEGDIVLNALVGIRGFIPTLRAIEAGKTIALANKETLVAGGDLVMAAAAKKGVAIYPVDSEHSAIFQCLQGAGPNPFKKILLTASGGPFRGFTKEQLEHVQLADALKHPNWSMGKKVTVDSATLVNKGLELIEAHHLFDATAEQIEVLVHPQSIVHSMIQYEDGGVIAQLGVPDMRLPIAYALTYPERLDSHLPVLDFATMAEKGLTFEKPDLSVFCAPALAADAIRRGGTAATAFNGAAEVLTGAFLEERIGFLPMMAGLEKVLTGYKEQEIHAPEDVLAADYEIRKKTEEVVTNL